MAHIATEGYRERVAASTSGFACAACKHASTKLLVQCPACGEYGTFVPLRTRDEYADETRRIKLAHSLEHFSPGYDSTNLDCQRGKMMLPEQLFMILRAAISGLVVRRGFNFSLQKELYKLYIPFQWKEEDKQFVTEIERNDNLKFICACEVVAMPEFDLLKTDEDGASGGISIRGWRSVMGIFYRIGLLPWMPPDDGNRKSLWEIRNSKIN